MTDLLGDEHLMSLWAAIDRSQAIIQFDLDGYVLSANDNYLGILGYTLPEIAGRHHAMFCDPSHVASEDYRQFWAKLRKGEFESAEYRRLGKNGREVWLQASYNPILDEDGRPLKIVKFATDVTVKGINRKLARQIRLLERSNSDLDDFAYIASHDLKEPLRGIANNARFLREDYADLLPLVGANRLSRLIYLSQRMEQIIDDLLYASRLANQELAVQSADLDDIVRDILLMSETVLRERNATVVVTGELPAINCDKIRVTELLRNLIMNAIKYNDSETRRVEIGYLEQLDTNDGVESQVFFVKDNGIGIAPEFHDDVFRLFKRLNVEDDTHKGTGVGLTFARKIVERHGGRIWVEAALGKGSVFYFTLSGGAADETRSESADDPAGRGQCR